MLKEYIKSPLNYTGGKYKILDNIISQLPNNINTFIDAFGGGFNVGINVSANKIIYNDHIVYLKEMFQFFRDTDSEIIFNDIKKIISDYNLSNENNEGYLMLREDYNTNKNILFLFVLTCFSFNHQIRFNNQHKFNTPFGKKRSSYNLTIESNLFDFINNLKSKNIEFYSKDFSFIRECDLKANDFVYCDPPYLISNASYNDGKRGFKNWTQNEDLELLKLLDELNNKNVRFLLSNVLEHKGETNDNLIQWSKKYNVKKIDKNYNNCNYQLKNKTSDTQEVIIYNY
ncbi:MAG: Dam family site-specific DNA-(adenine-N6)-methyltransferase [Candidatus Gastranaerophilales bacterium]